MIGAVREWLTSIVAVSMLLSLVQTLIPEGSIRKIAGFTGGLLLLIVLIHPIPGMDLQCLRLDLSDYKEAVSEKQEELKQTQKESMIQLIESRTGAYISDKAKALGLAVKVRVNAKTGPDGVPIPVSVRLQGTYSESLAAYIEEELGIIRERQVWNEEN